MNKTLTLFIGIIFLLLMTNFIIAADTTVLSKAGSFINELTNGIPDDAKAGLGKILLATLVVLLVFSILGFVPFLSDSSTGIQWTVSIIIGILSFLFVSPKNIEFIMANYEALGITLTTILPLLIIIAFSLKIARDRRYGLSWGIFISKFAIILFAIYDIGRWLTISWDTSQPTPVLAWMYPLSLIIAIIWFFAARKIVEKVDELEKKKEEEGVRGLQTNATSNIINNATQQRIQQIMNNFDQTGHISIKDQKFLRTHGAGHLMFGKDVS